MENQDFVIADIIDLEDGYLVFGLSIPSLDQRMELRELSLSTIRNRFEGKEIEIASVEETIKLSILAVDVGSSVADFKNIFLKVHKTAESLSLKILDEVSIDVGS